MIFGVILAGGIGSRMGSGEKPKQYINIGRKPIIIHTVEKFMMISQFEKILVLCPEEWMEYTDELIGKHIQARENIIVLSGVNTRNETLMNAIKYIDSENMLNEDTIIVTHDAVRPFVTTRILKDNIKALEKYEACDTVIPATDTIVQSKDGDIISSIPDRKYLYQGQTPQSFKAKKLQMLYNELSEDEKDILTDAAKIFAIKNQSVHLVKGETFNIKITYPYDLTVAESLIRNGL